MSLAVTAVVAVAASAYVSYDNAQKARDQQERAMAQAKAASDKQAATQEQEINRANGKRPDVAGILSANQQAAKAGGGGTMLTGPQGVDPNSLSLGKATLLGA